ncbi:MAG: thiolase family protein [Desulfobacter sp.]|nr:MAG: thiolase family protein [Desulfobacter sp.]
MTRKVAVCAMAQINNQSDYRHLRYQGMLMDCFESIIHETHVTFDMEKGIRNVVTCSDDVFDARTISDEAITDAVGAHYRGEEKVAQDGISALGYAMACILSGHDDLILVLAHCKESQSESRNMCTNLAFDPFYTRALGMDYLSASGFQARAYMQASGLDDEDLARIVVRSRQNGAKTAYARPNDMVSMDQVLESPMAADPIRRLHQYPVTDWAAGFLLCCEERAHEFTDTPVWLTGFGSGMDHFFLGDRDLVANAPLKHAAARAYAMAGIDDPAAQLDIVELNDAYAYQLPLWAEGAGLAEPCRGKIWMDQGGMDRSCVNLSGGMLNGNPLMLGGLARAAYAVSQLRGEAGENQVESPQRALAHGTTGPAGQHHAVLILEK